MEVMMNYVQPFFDWLLQTTLIGSVVICLILAAQKTLGGKLGPRWCHALWLVLLIRMVLPWSPSSRISLFNLIPSWDRQGQRQQLPETTEQPEPSQPAQTSRTTKAIPVEGPKPDAAIQKQTTPKPGTLADMKSKSKAQLVSLRRVLSLLWLAGATVVGAYLLVSNFTLWRIVKRDRPLVNQAMLELFEECKVQMGVQALVVVVPSSQIRSPALFGFVRPRLLLPSEMLEKASQEEMRYVFLHELAHLKRRDIYVGWLTSFLQVLHWFNPLVWFAFYRMRSDRELACDALVLARMGQEESQEYGRAIIGLLRRFSRSRPLPAMAGILENRSQLKRRIKMIARFKKNSYRWSPLAVILIILLACVSLPDAKRTKASETSAAPPAGANIIWVTSMRDHNFDGVQDDQTFIDWLVAEGHTVDVRIDYWNELNLEPNKVDELNAADLVIISRSVDDRDHDDGNETTLWNSVTTPLITMNSYLVRLNRWRWMSTIAHAPKDLTMRAVDPTHPVFDGVTFERGNLVTFLDKTVGSGKTTFVNSLDVGNGTLIAQTLSHHTWIAEWSAGVEFYAGSGQIAGGPRMLFTAGTQQTEGSPPTPWGAWNLTAEGEKMFRNAINYMLPAALIEPPVEPPAEANIIWVTSTRDYDVDGVQDDQAWIDWLVAEGHTVDVRIDYWNELDLEPAKVDELNAADLVIISRSVNSHEHDDGNEPTLWNSVTTPLITMNCFLARSLRWRWMDTTIYTIGDYIMLASDTSHPVFDCVTFEGDNMVTFLDNTVGSGFTTFVGSIDVGNGTLIAQTLGANIAWIAEWSAGVEFYAGSGQIAGGRRMLFTAGTQETIAPDPLTPWGAWNLTAEGEQIFRNAIAYMLPAAPEENIIWVTSTRDYDLDGVQDDQGFIDWLVAEGYYVDVRIDYWKELDAAKIDELNAADLVIMSRSTYSGDHDDGDEPTLWNSVTSPMIVTTAYLPRTNRWAWMNINFSENTDAILMALDTTHPLFDGVTFEEGNLVIYLDNTVGSGLTTFVGSTDVGNGTLIAQASGADWALIAEWPAGVEFYAGSDQIAGGRRMLFTAGTEETSGPPPTPWGAFNLTAEGEKMFRNAINYMLPAAPEVPVPVAHWQLDEGFGTIAADSSGNGLDGTVMGDPLWVAGIIGGALEFDGVDDNVNCGNPPILDFGTGDWTLSAWMKAAVTPAGDVTIVGKGGDHTSGILPGVRYQMLLDSSDYISPTLDDNTNKYNPGGEIPVIDGQWHHIVMMRRNGTELRLYVNGVEDAGVTNHKESTIPVTYDLSGTSKFNAYIGAITNAENSTRDTVVLEKLFVGMIDDVRIYDYALSEAEIEIAALASGQ